MDEKPLKPVDVDSYIVSADGAARPILEELRAIIKATVPDVQEGISWGVPFYRHHGALAGLAAYKNHVSFGLGGAVLQSRDRKLLEDSGYVTGKKTVRIRFDQEVPAAVIQRLLQAQAEMNRSG